MAATAAVIGGLRLRRLSVAALLVGRPRQTDAAAAVRLSQKQAAPRPRQRTGRRRRALINANEHERALSPCSRSRGPIRRTRRGDCGRTRTRIFGALGFGVGHGAKFSPTPRCGFWSFHPRCREARSLAPPASDFISKTRKQAGASTRARS